MRSARRSKRLALALVGTLAAVVTPLSVSAPVWAAPAPAGASEEPSPGQWKQLDKIARAHAALGVSEDSAGPVLRLPAGTSADEQAKVKAELPAGAHTAVKTSKFGKGELDKMEKDVMARKWHHDADKYGFSFAYDAATDKVVIATDAPDSITKPLRGAHPDAVEVHLARLDPQDNRFADSSPFYGGVALVANGSMCTAGFPIKNRPTGHVLMTTAGHCYALNTHVYNRRTDNSNGNWVGKVVSRFWTDLDTELLDPAGGNVSYFPDIWTGGYQTSTSSKFLAGWQSVYYGKKVCVSGSVSYNHCGHPINNSHYSVRYQSGAGITNGRGFSYQRGGIAGQPGALTKGGDSGAPIYVPDNTGTAAWIAGGHSGLAWDTWCGCQMMIGVKGTEIGATLNSDLVRH